MDGISSLPLDEDSVPFFYIGQHETERRISVSEELFGHAQELGYAFLTTPITTKHFHARVISQLTTHQETLGATFDQDADTDEGEPTPSISPLTSLDTDLQPGTYNTMLVGVVSPWIDVASPDPIVAHVSRQVLHMELAYAAFCGIVNVVMYGPVSPSTVTQFSQAVREALGVGPFIHLQILLPMSGELEQDYGDASHLCELAREQYVDESDDTEDEDGLSVWDSWNAIRTVCRYSPHLSIGKFHALSFCPIPISIFFPAAVVASGNTPNPEGRQLDLGQYPRYILSPAAPPLYAPELTYDDSAGTSEQTSCAERAESLVC